MELFFEIATVVLPVFTIVFLGYGLKRVRLIDERFTSQSNRLVYNVCLPLLLFYKIGASNFFVNFNGALVAGGALAIFLVFFLSYLFATLRRYPPAVRGAFCQGAFRGNLAIIGLAVVSNAHGDAGMTRASILMGFMVPVLNLLAIVALLLPHHEGKSKSMAFWLKQVLFNPLIIASFLGVAWSVAGLSLPLIVERPVQIVSSLTLPLALIAIGAGFTFERLHGDLRRAGLAAFCKIVLLPLLTGLLLWLFGVRTMDFSVGVLMIGSPTAAVSYIMASQMKGDAELAGSIIVLATLFSILTYSLILLAVKLWVL